MRKFRDEGHTVYIISPTERRLKNTTRLIKDNGVTILKVKTLNLQKTNMIEKGVGTLMLEYQIKLAVKKHFNHVKFDLILYSTPPITLTSVIQSLKQKTGAKTYLLLKDIFPQNAVDLGLLKKKGLLYRYFRRKETKLYELSDHIGCMSPANVAYLLKHNPKITPDKVEVNPNSIELNGNYISTEEKIEIRKKYNIPEKSIVFVYGGNLGKPQGLNFLLEVIQANKQKENVFFLIVGSGTEYNKLNNWFNKNKPENALLLSALPKESYDKLIQTCEVGLILLDKRFTIPNFPSRLLSYLEYKMPVISATDTVTDIGRITEENGFGFSLIHGEISVFNVPLDKIIKKHSTIKEMGENGYNFLMNNYTVNHSYKIIMSHFIEKVTQSPREHIL